MNSDSASIDYESRLRRALDALQKMRVRLETIERSKTEPIAIIGMGCRFPGGANDPETYWRLLRDGVDAVAEVPPARWNIDAFYDPDPDRPGKMYTRYGAFLKDVDQFDPHFFGIAPREAVSMDPQQRLLLEVTWEALEHAGQPVEELVGSNTGVFIGISTNDYSQLNINSGDPARVDAYSGTGICFSVSSGRLAYVLGFQGPNLAVDTACSSSLVSVHLACQSLRTGKCNLALAGGVNLILSPIGAIYFSKVRALSPDGRCKTFDAAADGYGRGEGCAVIVLKRLSDAVSDGDSILALIRGSAVNHDGRSSGLTVPNGLSQQALIREALIDAGVEPARVSYVEAHGTGTPLGDPIEVQALAAVLREARPQNQPLALGSVKTNIGHLEAAAGVAGLIKVVLALRKREIPPHLHLKKPNPHISWDQLPVLIPTHPMPWAPENSRRIAGVSSFGFSGTNAHVILEEAPERDDVPPRDDAPAPNGACLLPLSARSPQALSSLVRRYHDYFAAEKANPSFSFRDICYTASVRRSHHSHRLALVAQSTESVMERMVTSLKEPHGDVFARKETGRNPSLVFVFCGQGSQWWGMGRELIQKEPVFRGTLEQCEMLLRPYTGWSLLEEMTVEKPRSRLAETEIAQPALFALQVALAALWQSWGVKPDAVVGHSMGEVAAAYVAGVISLEDSVRLICHRGRLMQRATGKGKMAAVELPRAETERCVAEYGGRLSIAAVNSPTSTVLSGDADALEEVLQSLAKREILCRLLPVNYAFHSPQMEPLEREIVEALGEVRSQTEKIPIFSTVTGKSGGGADFDAGYWGRNLKLPVLFETAVSGLLRAGYNVFLEISPHPVLSGMISQCLTHAGADGTVLYSLRRGQEERGTLLGTLGALYTLGWPVNWRGLYPSGGRVVRLPSYPWQRQRYWIEGGADAFQRGSAFSRNGTRVSHPLLGRRLSSPLRDIQFESQLSTASLPYLGDHRIYGMAVIPATAYMEMALAAAAEFFGAGASVLEDVVMQEALLVPEDKARTIQVILTPEDAETASCRILSRDESPADRDQSWTLHTSGRVRKRPTESVPSKHISLEELRARCREELPTDAYYEMLREQGLAYGPCLRGIERLWRTEGEALGCIRLPQPLESEIGWYLVHPALLDASLQVLAATVPGNAEHQSSEDIFLPVGMQRMQIYGRTDTRLWSHAALRRVNGSNSETLTGDIRLFDESGKVLVELDGLSLKRGRRETLLRGEHKESGDSLYEIQWQPKDRAGPANYLGGPRQVALHLQPRIAELHLQHGLMVYRDLSPELDRLSAAYAVKAFRKLGCQFHPGDRVAVERLSVIPQHRRLLRRLMEMLEEENILRREAGEWQVCREPETTDPDARCSDLIGLYPACRAELALLRRCGRQLAEVLRGECDPLQLLFPAGSLTLVEELYQESPHARALNTLVQEAVGKALVTLPITQKIRILEIGAGTGGTTSYVLSQLPANRTDYVFTDISPLFTSNARQKFRDRPFVRYELLDIERDPAGQGFAAHAFDLILAANVLHATSDLRQTLTHIKQLLAPEGLLVLQEITARQRWVDLVFGLTEGWWRFADSDLRPSYPLLDRDKWLGLLQEIGFAEAAAIPRGADSGAGISEQVVILARIPGLAHQALASPPSSKSGRWLIFTDQSGTGAALAELLKQHDQSCVQVHPGDSYEALPEEQFKIDPANPEDFRRLIKEGLWRDQPCLGVVHLWSLDTASSEETTGSSLEFAERLACGSALHLVQALAHTNWDESPRLWLVTRGAQAVAQEPVAVAQAPLWGLGSVVASEHPEFHCTRVDLDSSERVDEARRLMEEISTAPGESRVAFRRGMRHVARLVRSGAIGRVQQELRIGEDQSLQLDISPRGALENLRLRPGARRRPDPGEVEIRVLATGLNFLDVMDALGVLPFERNGFGAECAGTIVAIGEGVDDVQPGKEVIAIAPGSFSSYVTTRSELVAIKPDGLSLEEAATIPSAFLTAHYALHELAQMAAGDRVLIHAAAGGVGLAAVQLAQRADAVIFGTAGSPEKRHFLRSLGVQHVMNSRSLDFADEVMACTGGKGVDIVLNSLAGEFIPKSLSVLGSRGRFLEIGKTGIWEKNQVSRLRPDVAYFAVALDHLIREAPAFVGSMLRQLLEDFKTGALKPLPRRVFPIRDVVPAFRTMAQSRHIGKIVVTQEDSILGRTEGPKVLRSNGSYLITGGLGGLGLLLARWMVAHGARHLALVGRKGATSAARETLVELERRGARVLVKQVDVSQRVQVEAVLEDMRRDMPPLLGIIHAAGVLDDGVLLQQTWARFSQVMAPKVQGAWNLHALTQNRSLDFFVLFSSGVSFLGSAAQGNHAAANAFLDALAHYRRSLGLSALSINWGAWTGEGAAAERNVGQRIQMLGMGTIAPHQGLEVLERLLQQKAVQVAVLPVKWQEFLRQFSVRDEASFFDELARATPSNAETRHARAQRSQILQKIRAAPSTERRTLLAEHIREQAVRVLGLDPSSFVDPRRPLNELGLDSLMAVELRNELATTVGRKLSATLLFDYPTIEVLARHLAKEMFPTEPSVESSLDLQADGKDLVEVSPKMEELSEQDVLALLAEEVAANKRRQQ